ncbi:MAG: SDR family oxidoreductase [Planctomycetes bacterium]|nr:SDR family oxidoreductase [Planctomycetota bacterium]
MKTRTTRPFEKRPASRAFKAEKQRYPAKQSRMKRKPDSDLSNYLPAGKLRDKIAIITGGDSGIGRAVAIAFAMEGADVAIVYNVNDDDAADTRAMVEAKGRRCLVIRADVRRAASCKAAVARTVRELGGLDVLVNNAAYQVCHERIEKITEAELRRTFETNIFGYFFMAQAALPHLKAGNAIINTGSIVGMVGHKLLVPYCSTKGAIHAFTKALALNLGERGIRVNAVIPGPVWTPNIPGTMPREEVRNFGNEVALERPGQPEELAPAYVYLASEDGSFVTGSLIEVTGGKLSSG